MRGCSIRPDRRAIGVAGEYTARLALEEEGLRLLDTNWRDGRRGELDIIARDETDPSRSWTVIVEVRTRVGRRHGSALASIDERKVTQLRKLTGAWCRALASVDHRKVARLRALTGAWCRAHGHLASRVRIDVVAITVDARTLESWPAPMDEAVDLRALGAQVVWLRGVQ